MPCATASEAIEGLDRAGMVRLCKGDDDNGDPRRSACVVGASEVDAGDLIARKNLF